MVAKAVASSVARAGKKRSSAGAVVDARVRANAEAKLARGMELGLAHARLAMGVRWEGEAGPAARILGPSPKATVSAVAPRGVGLGFWF